MAKLIDILARELKVWPEGAKSISQSFAGMVFYVPPSDCVKEMFRTEVSENWRLSEVTRAEWQAAVDALNAPKVVEWDGVGLPPVGVKVEVILEDDGLLPKSLEGWKKGDIVECIAHFSACGVEVSPVFFNKSLFLYSSLRSDCYRPIRTAEQLAAEEREMAVQGMCEYGVDAGDDTIYLTASALYDAGYRKQ